MNFSELKRSLDNPKKVYLLEGEEAFFRTRGVELIKGKFLQQPDFNLTNIEGSQLKGNLSPLTDALSMCPFLSDYRVIVINEWYPVANDFKNKELSNFFNSPLDITIVVINNKSKSELLKKQSQVEFVDCKKADISLICRYLQNEAKKHNLIIAKSCAELIADYCLYDMNKISVEMAKLVSLSDGKVEITVEDVKNNVNKDLDYEIYEVVNYIAKKEFDKAYNVISDMIIQGGEASLIPALYSHFRRLLYVSCCNDSNQDIAKTLGVREYAVVKAKEQARSFTPKRIMNITKKLIEYDASFKSGKIMANQAVQNAVFMILTEN